MPVVTWGPLFPVRASVTRAGTLAARTCMKTMNLASRVIPWRFAVRPEQWRSVAADVGEEARRALVGEDGAQEAGALHGLRLREWDKKREPIIEELQVPGNSCKLEADGNREDCFTEAAHRTAQVVTPLLGDASRRQRPHVFRPPMGPGRLAGSGRARRIPWTARGTRSNPRSLYVIAALRGRYAAGAKEPGNAGLWALRSGAAPSKPRTRKTGRGRDQPGF